MTDYFLDAFVRRGDGSWECVAHASFQGPHGRIEVTRGSVFTPGNTFMGVDLAAWLEKQATQKS
jgi:hypothetical protein